MPPMDFEEFRWAMGDEVSVPFAKECHDAVKPLGQAMRAYGQTSSIFASSGSSLMRTLRNLTSEPWPQKVM